MSGLEGLLAGRVLGDRYRIEEVIGRGGMGAVYRAVDERLGREVAVKVVTVTGGLDEEARERLRARFQREARAAAALPHHPNVVPVYDYGTDPTLGLDYIVMELLRGDDLAARLARSGPPPLAAGLKILVEAARGVAVGHRAGLIHRDVKPGNLFLAEHHGEVQVRVLDFGIAKLVEDEDTLAHLTQDGRAPHSPAFASPEQLRGLGQLTPASDVFSLGAVGFQLLTGERPFTEADRNRMSLGMPVPPPSPRERNPAIPTAVASVIERALDFEPQRRFADAGVMAVELGQALRSLPDAPLEPYMAAPAPPAGDADDRTQLFEADDRTLLAPPGAAQPPARRREATPPPRRAVPPPPPLEKRRSWGSIFLWTLVLLVLAGAGVAFWMEMESGPRLAREEELPPPPDTLPLITPDVAVQESIASDPLDAYMYNREGLRMYEEGDYAGALERFRLASELFPDNPDFRYNYALALLRTGSPGEAIGEFRRVLQASPGRAGAYYNLGLAHLELGDTTAAWTYLQDAADAAESAGERARALSTMRAIERAQTQPTQQPIQMDTSGAGTPLPVPGPDTARPPAAPRRDTAAAPRDTARGGE